MRKPAAVTLVRSLAVVAALLFVIARTPARAQEGEDAGAATDSGGESESAGESSGEGEGAGEAGEAGEFQNDSIVEDAHNPANAGDSGEGGESPAPKHQWRIREKQAEGTKANKKLDEELVIQSQYKLNGRSLEVDPD